MKEFVKMMLAVICAFLVMQIVGFFLFFIMIGSMAALGSGKTVLPREGVLDVDMAQFSLAEQTVDDQLSGFSLSGFSNVATVGLWDAIQAIDAAAAAPAIPDAALKAAGGGRVDRIDHVCKVLSETKIRYFVEKCLSLFFITNPVA